MRLADLRSQCKDVVVRDSRGPRGNLMPRWAEWSPCRNAGQGCRTDPSPTAKRATISIGRSPLRAASTQKCCCRQIRSRKWRIWHWTERQLFGCSRSTRTWLLTRITSNAPSGLSRSGAELAVLLDRGGRGACRHHPEPATDLPGARDRSAYVHCGCSATDRHASSEGCGTTHASALEESVQGGIRYGRTLITSGQAIRRLRRPLRRLTVYSATSR